MKNNELIITDCSWDSRNELHIEPMFENWENPNGNSEVMTITTHDLDYNGDEVSVDIHLEDMVKLYEFLGEKIDFLRNSKGYMKHFTDDGEYEHFARPHLDEDYDDED